MKSIKNFKTKLYLKMFYFFTEINFPIKALQFHNM
jgi:hypothetical protein